MKRLAGLTLVAIAAAAAARGQAEPAAPETPKNGPSCAAGMALIAGQFCIDQFEASTALASGKPHSPYHRVGPQPVIARSQRGAIPQAHISFNQAEAACVRAGKRLCTTTQWVDACMGTRAPKRVYPYGVREQLRACNTEHTGHPQLVLLDGRRKTDSGSLNDARLNQLSGSLAPAGAFPGCVTPDGVFDLHGNLLEWTRGDRPLLMGGYYADARENGEGCKYVTMLHGADYHDFTTGFRCCSDPSAATAAQDPPGLRSFSSPGAPLPPLPKPPPYADQSAACPEDMVLVEGLRCAVPTQTCLRWVDEPGKPQRACGEFAPVPCGAKRRKMRYCIDRYEYTPAGHSLPLVHVSWNESQRICRAMDKRLCYEDEWEFACEGPEASPYPYGRVRDGAACNHDVSGTIFTAAGKLIDRRVPSSSLPRCKSPFGVFSLVGNVDEWTTRAGNETPWRSILRGGWWLKGRSRCRAATESHNEIYAGPQTSFRCCREARR